MSLVRENLGGFILTETNCLLGEAEVEQLDALLGDEDICRLQIAMRDSLPVCSIQSI